MTEELWSHLKDENEQLLIIETYPEYSEEYNFSEDQEMMNKQIELVSSIRNLRSSVNISPKEKVKVEIFLDDSNISSYFSSQDSSILEMSGGGTL